MRRMPTTTQIALAAVLVLAALNIGAPISAEEGREPPATISIDIRDADLSDALVLLANETGISIAMPFAVEGKVSASLNGVSLSSALTALLAPFDLTWRVDGNGVYFVCRKGEEIAANPPAIDSEEDEARESNLLIEKIPLRYTDPYWLCAFLTGDETRESLGVGNLSIIPNPWDNSLLGRFGGPRNVAFPPYGDPRSWTGPTQPSGGPSEPGSGPGPGGGGGGTQ